MGSSRKKCVGAKALQAVLLTGAGFALLRLLRRQADMSLVGKVVLVTGSSRGLGLALAEEFGRRGAKLCLTARSPEELNAAKAILIERGAQSAGHILTIPADLRDNSQCKSLMAQAMQHFGAVDILVNNAGVISVGPIENQSVTTFRDVMNANFFAGMQCSLAVLPAMLERSAGTIVNIASIGGKVAVPHLLPYTASKFAVVGFSEGLGAELRRKGVHVLTVCPGLMRTGSHVRAQFSGDASREYRWFSLLANLPGLSASARHAAHVIVDAVERRKTEITITPAAAIAAPIAPALPTVTTIASSLVSSMLLPDSRPEAGSQLHEGRTRRDRESVVAATIGAQAADQGNELT